MLNYSLYLGHPDAYVIHLYLMTVSRPSCAHMLFTNLRIVAAMSLLMGKHPALSWYAVESNWELTSLGKMSNLPVPLLSKITFVKQDTKPRLKSFLFLLKLIIHLVYLYMNVFQFSEKDLRSIPNSLPFKWPYSNLFSLLVN